MDTTVKAAVISKVILYYRQGMKQGCASMEVQRAAAEDLRGRTKAKVIAEYVEQETGDYKGNRPKLAEAIAHCRESGACLVFGRVGRLVRNRGVTLALLNSGIEFLCCDNPVANKETIHILAATAETEGRQASQRTKETLAALKKAGVKLGSNRPGHWKGREHLRGWDKAVANASARRMARAKDHYAFLVPEIKRRRDEGGTYAEIVEWLNQQGHLTTVGKPFTQVSLFRLIGRYLGKEYLGRARPGGNPGRKRWDALGMKRSDVEAYYAPLIREITQMRDAGSTYDEITTKLNERGSLTAGGRPFDMLLVRRLHVRSLGKRYVKRAERQKLA